ncbi:MAG: hypothetical protein A3E85_03235 [Gammaproteobacteria bacterium RIFCSPHIGHO2_12_FULL_45_12]|nr:MAG: hypothetical protein A3E85_03235 [Gammaproteobacteria bacterium RIFCSPHIGHO2_12_FULL_45_12]
MGYPDALAIPVSDTQAYKQFGNSVAVPVMSAVAAYMKQYIFDIIHLSAPRKKSKKKEIIKSDPY